MMNLFINGYECLKNKNNGRISELASKYHQLYKECLENFNSCYKDAQDIDDYGCTCPLTYLFYMKPINMKKGVCHRLSPSEFSIAAKNYKATNSEVKEVLTEAMNCLSQSGRNLRYSFDSLKRISDVAENRNADPIEICTCETDLCHEHPDHDPTGI